MECYFPNGDLADGHKPCNSTAEVSHCCRSGDVCITNGFCLSTGLNALVRRSCTDKTFNSTECPQQCTTGDKFNSADVVLIPCDTYTTFCCGQDEAARNCCTTGNGTVRLPAAEPMQNEAIPSTITITATSTASATISPSITSASASTNCTSQHNTAIGVGAALGVVTLAAVCVAAMWWRSQSKVKKTEEKLRISEDNLRTTDENLRITEDTLRKAKEQINEFTMPLG